MKKRHYVHIVEDDEPTNKKFRRGKDNSDEEYVLTSALIGTIFHQEQ